MLVTTLFAAAAILAQGAVLWMLLRAVRTFGAYAASHKALTDALLYHAETNQALHQSHIAMIAALRAQSPHATKEVA